MRDGDTPRDIGDLIRFGTIASVDLGAGRCTVQAGDLVTGPIRWIEVRAGKTRTWSPPSIEEQVILICAEGELAAGVALRGISSSAYPPAGNALRELIAFEDGAVIAYNPEAHLLEAILPEGGKVNVSAPGGMTISGPVSIDGRLTVSEDIVANGDVTGSGISLAHHQHSLVRAGTDKSGPPAAS